MWRSKFQKQLLCLNLRRKPTFWCFDWFLKMKTCLKVQNLRKQNYWMWKTDAWGALNEGSGRRLFFLPYTFFLTCLIIHYFCLLLVRSASLINLRTLSMFETILGVDFKIGLKPTSIQPLKQWSLAYKCWVYKACLNRVNIVPIYIQQLNWTLYCQIDWLRIYSSYIDL